MSAENASAPNPYQKPVQASDPSGPPRYPGYQGPVDSKKVTFAQRLAGGLMVLNGVLILLEMGVLPPTQASGSPQAFSIGPAILDILLGIALLSGTSSVVGFTIVRAALGATAGAALRAPEGPVAVIYSIVLCVSLIGLLAGKAGRVRIAIAGSSVALCLALEMVGLIGATMGSNPLAFLFLAAAGDVEGTPVKQAQGRSAPYSLAFPNDRWYQRKPEAAAKQNAVADLWFTRPDKDAHLLVIAEQAPGKTLTADAYANAIADNMKQDVPNLTFDAREPWAPNPVHGRVLKMRGRRDKLDLVWYCVSFTAFDRGYYMLAFGTPETMRDLDGEIRAITDSFRVPKEVLEALPPDVNPARISVVRGVKLPYTLAVPEGWFLRKDEVMKVENPDLDRWIVRPELDAHIIVVAEEVPAGFELPLDKYTEVVLENARKQSKRFDEVSRERWGKFPADGMRVHASTSREGLELEYEYAIYARGNRGYQVTAFTTKTSYELAKADMLRALDSFEPAP